MSSRENNGEAMHGINWSAVKFKRRRPSWRSRFETRGGF
jgi:hypothetical protein